VVREAQRMMMRTRRRVWEQVQVQGEQGPVHRQLGKMARVQKRVKPKRHHQRAGKRWCFCGQRC
jgi:hypothetical protein